MKYLKQFLIIITVSLLGELIHFIVPLSIPGSIYGIVIMFALLKLRILKLEDVEETGSFLVEIMPVMFVPVCVGIIDSWDIVKGSWLKYLILIIISTVVVMVMSGRVTQWILRKDALKTDDKQIPENEEDSNE